MTDQIPQTIMMPASTKAVIRSASVPKAISRTPQTIQKAVRELISTSLKEAQEDEKDRRQKVGKDPDLMNKKELEKEINRLTKKMNQAATELNFELAAILRDELIEMKVRLRDY